MIYSLHFTGVFIPRYLRPAKLLFLAGQALWQIQKNPKPDNLDRFLNCFHNQYFGGFTGNFVSVIHSLSNNPYNIPP